MCAGIISEQHETNVFQGVPNHASMAKHQPVPVSLSLWRFAPCTTVVWAEIWNGSLRNPHYENHSSVSVLCSIYPWLFQMTYRVILTCMPLKLQPWMKKKRCFRNTNSRASRLRGQEMAQPQRTGFGTHMVASVPPVPEYPTSDMHSSSCSFHPQT